MRKSYGIEVKVKTQTELDEALKAGHTVICIKGRFSIGGSASVVAWENSSVVARGNSSVEARGNSSVVAWGNSSVEARENSSVVAWGNVFVRLFAALKISAKLSVVIMRHDGGKTPVEGGQVIEAVKPTIPQQWCDHYGVEVNDGIATLYKALNDDYTSPHKFSYAPGTIPIAPDWDGGEAECGGGLHFSPRPKMALSFHDSAKRFMACPVSLADIVVHPDGEYPEKVKAKGCCAPVYEVDRNGKRIES